MTSPLSRLSIPLLVVFLHAAAPDVARAQRATASWQPAHDDAALEALGWVPQRSAEAPKSPGTAALISFVITGGGQVYNEEYAKGAIMFGLGVVSTVMIIDGIDEYGCDEFEECWSWLLPTGLVAGLTVKVWSIFDAAAGAKRWNGRHNLGMLDVRPEFGVARLPDGTVGVTVLSASF